MTSPLLPSHMNPKNWRTRTVLDPTEIARYVPFGNTRQSVRVLVEGWGLIGLFFALPLLAAGALITTVVWAVLWFDAVTWNAVVRAISPWTGVE